MLASLIAINLVANSFTSWIQEHDKFILWAGLASVVMFFGTLIIIPILIARMGEDYFLPDRPKSFANQHPAVRLLGLILKNLLGAIFLVMGIIMIFVPGQGLLTILIGLALLNFPGKREAEIALASYPPVQRSISWIRKKAGRPPLKMPQVDD